jgi:hypothetical protein
MKKIMIALLFLCFNNIYAQDLPNFDEIKLEQKSDYKSAESSVTKAVDYMLSTPFDKKDINRLKSLQFLMKWMSGTPDFSFNLDNLATKISKGNDDILGLYLACMTKYCMGNRESAKDDKLVKLNSLKLLLDYCEKPDNKIKMTKELKKLSDANKKGELESNL